MLLNALGRAVAVLTLVVSFAAPTWAAGPATERRLMEIDERLTRLEGVLNNGVLLEMLQRIDSLQRELQAVRDTTDHTAHELEGIKARQRALYSGLDKRSRTLETANVEPEKIPAPPNPALSSPPKNTAPAPSLVERPARTRVPGTAKADIPPRPDLPPVRSVTEGDVGRTTDEQAYQSAFNRLKAGRNEEAIAAFNEFLANYPASEYASNAQYWLAEANYVSGDFERAAQAFKDVIGGYPGSSKVPDAKLKLGFTLYELQQWEQARAVLSDLNAQYPNTSVAQLAENRLQRMSREGR